MSATARRAASLAILVAALGYFVDIYDLILFTIVRKASLQSLGVPATALLDTGAMLISRQMLGMLVGGLLWGILGDKRGRLSVLFGSIILYSLANIANGFVHDVSTYAILRFVAGIGLAGELGAGITLVSEVTDRHRRGYGTTIVATIGICGAVVAALIGDRFSWRTAYFVGGGMGLALLALRIGLYESGMYDRVKQTAAVRRGDLRSIFASPGRARRYLALILVGVPIWYAVGILITFSPEIGAAMHMPAAPAAGKSVMYTYIGLAVGDLASGALSQLLRSRKRALLIFLLLTTAAVAAYFTVGRASLAQFYIVCGLLGFATGYWAVFVTVAAEQFGTNIRATATTTAPNFVRGAVVPLAAAFTYAKGRLGVVESALGLGILCLALALLALASLEETYGKDLDYVEV